MKDELQQATNLIRKWYYAEIHALVDAAIEACCGRLVTELTSEDLAEIPTRHRASARESFRPYRIPRETKQGHSGLYVRNYRERDEGVDPREFLTEWVDQATDDHQFVIYTLQARCALLASDNEGAYESDMGDPPPSPEAAACAAMRADVWDLLDARSDEWQIPEVDHGPDCPALIDSDARCTRDDCQTTTPTTWGVRS